MYNYIKSKINRSIHVPKDISGLITYNPKEEVPPSDAGMTRKEVATIWTGVEELYRTGVYPGISFCLRRQGKVVLQRAIGHSHGNGYGDPPDAKKIRMTPETPLCQFSASKAITAMMIHLLVEQGKIHLSDPVAHYIQKFAANGKHHITIYHLISHHGGIPTPPTGVDPDILFDHEAFIRLLCDSKPASEGGKQMAYHAITGGAIMGEIVRRVTGVDIGAFLRKSVQKPLGFKYFSYGVPEKQIPQIAVNYDTGWPLVFPISYLAKRALSVPWGEVVRISNEPRFMQVIIPAANLVATADEMSQFFQMMLNGGELNGVRIFDPLTIKRAVTAANAMKLDGTMVVPMRYSPGMMLGASPVGMWGPYSESAYGHVGFIHILCWADPARDIAVSLQTTGKPLVGPHLMTLARLLLIIGRNCKIKPGIPQTTQANGALLMPLQNLLRNLILGM
jgi:CubicO group peptidase (beta-lactamase class C family)